MIGTVITLSIALTVLVHGVHSARHAKHAEEQADLADIERARTHVQFLDLVDGWATVPDRCIAVVTGLDGSMQAALAIDNRAVAAVHARELLAALAPYSRADIVDA